jgi:predicted dehydrogenase
MSQILVCGLGLIGKQRVSALLEAGYTSDSIFVFDPKFPETKVKSEFVLIHNLDEAFKLEPERVIISTPHGSAVKLAESFLNIGSRVLIEKPMGRNLQESTLLHENKNSHNLSIGFNYRFMPAIQTLKHKVEKGILGEIHTIKLDLGHGGAPEDRESWKLDLTEAGGGAILDPGIHLLDLLNFIFGATTSNLEFKGAVKWHGFWNTGIEENVSAIAYLNKTIVNLSVSLVAWKTRFSVEVIGTDGYIQVNGRGRSDGPQTLTIGERWGWRSGKSQVESEIKSTVALKDDSLTLETKAWLEEDSNVASSQDGLLAEKLRVSLLRELGD